MQGGKSLGPLQGIGEGKKATEEKGCPNCVLPTPACPRKVWHQVTLTAPQGKKDPQVRKQRCCQGSKGWGCSGCHPPSHLRETAQTPENELEASALVAQPPQICKAVIAAIHLPAGTLGQSPGPRSTTRSATAATAAAAAAAGTAAAAPVLVDGDLDLRWWLRRAAAELQSRGLQRGEGGGGEPNPWSSRGALGSPGFPQPVHVHSCT